MPGNRAEPVLFAEGPETGLSLWTVTGNETRIALGSMVNHKPPIDRLVVVCRDDDPPQSSADKGIARTLVEWRSAGVDFRVATPWPSRRGDRSDFNDLLQAEGADAVRARIGVALSPSANIPHRLPLAEARRVLDRAIKDFFAAARDYDALRTAAGDAP